MEQKYTLVSAGTEAEIIRMVNSFLKEGWKVCGGISVINDPVGVYFYQSLVKEVTQFEHPPK